MSATKAAFVPRYLRGASLPPALRKALSCECGAPLHYLRPWFCCLSGWEGHGRLLSAGALWERAGKHIPRKLWQRFPRSLRLGEDGKAIPLVLRRLLALLVSQQTPEGP